jgi:uncharacterized membrane protein
MAFGSKLLFPRLGLALIGALLLSPFISIEPAYADLRVCNQTGDQVSIALGYRAERGWQSEGWWVANPQQCAIVYRGDLNSRFYYLYVADDIGGGAWDGSVYMCTRDESFTIFGVEDCLARGYERTGFFEIDTQNRSDWTLQLTEARPTAPDGSDVDGPAMDQLDGAPMDQGDDPGGAPMGNETPTPPGDPAASKDSN